MARKFGVEIEGWAGPTWDFYWSVGPNLLNGTRLAGDTYG
jgi:hypothetical protein